MSILIVSHCYAGLHPQYARLLRFQLSSLVLHPPKTEIVYAACLTPSDHLTLEALSAFASRLHLRYYPMDPPHLFRRCIGRNAAAKASQEDIVWFTDVDYVFGLGSLDHLDQNMPKSKTLVWPRRVLHSVSLEDGSKMTLEAEGDLFEIDPDRFEPRYHTFSIGGAQIVHGDFAREHGYLSGTKWQNYLETEPFRCFRDDGVYRRFCESQGKTKSIHIPEVYRIRHTHKTHED